MKICIAGKNNIAVDCLYYLLKFVPKENICVVLNRTDKLKNSWQKSLGFYANKENIEISSLEEVQKIKELIFLSLEFDRLIKPDLFQSNKLFNIHFSFLPEYKGMYTSLLPILHGKSYSGVTLHKIDRGIDTGDIIDQKRFNISNFTCGKLYSKYLEEGTKIVCKNLSSLIEGNFRSEMQPEINSTYFSKSVVNFQEVEINPFQTAYQIHLFIRAFNFRAYQLAKFNNQEIYSSEFTNKKSSCKPGTIIEEDNLKFIISTIDYDVLLFKDYYNELLKYGMNNDFEEAGKIIEYIPDLDERDSNGWNPLIIAAYNNSPDVVELLLKKGANPNSSNLNGTTALMYAKDAYLKTFNFSTINLLLNAGAEVYAKDIHEKDIFDYTNEPQLVKHLKNYNGQIPRS